MKELKKYCRNDVKMTLLVLLYLLEHKKVYMDGEEKSFTMEEFLELGQKPLRKEDQKKEEKPERQNNLF